MSTNLPTPLIGLFDDTSALDPHGPGIHAASAAFAERPLAGRLSVHDTDLPLLRGATAALEVVLGGGAGQVAGPVGLCARLGLSLAGIRLALRDYDDLGGNVRRVAAAVQAERDSGVLDPELGVCVELPIAESPYGWQAALDEAAAVELEVGLRLGGTGRPLPHPDEVAGWIDAALDRETPFRVTSGLDRAVSTPDGFGALNLLAATQLAWDGEGAAAVARMIGEQDPADVVDAATHASSARRWFRSAATAQVDPIADELTVLHVFTAP